MKLNTSDPIVLKNIEELDSRSAVGIKKYNTMLNREDLNINEWLQHSLEEQMDNLNYMRAIQHHITYLCNKYPNDMELGAVIRRAFNK